MRTCQKLGTSNRSKNDEKVPPVWKRIKAVTQPNREAFSCLKYHKKVNWTWVELKMAFWCGTEKACHRHPLDLHNQLWCKRAIITPIWIPSRLPIISQCHRWNICIALIDSLNTVKRPCAQFKEIQLLPRTSWRGALENQSDISKGKLHWDLRVKTCQMLWL